nr:unnamed protein product [Callosobruchus chinensis]
MERSNYSVIGLSETWLDHSISSDIFNIPGYSLVRKDRETRGEHTEIIPDLTIIALLLTCLNIKWETIFDLHDIDEIITFWNSSIIKVFDLHAPYITARITKKAAPWWTDNLKLMKKLKTELF